MTNELYEPSSIAHSGTDGMKWNKRKYQNPDGTWTELGKRMRREEYARKQKKKQKIEKKLAKIQAKEEKKRAKEAKKHKDQLDEDFRKNYGSYVKNLTDDELKERTSRFELEKKYIESESNRLKAEAAYKELTKKPEKHPKLKAGMQKVAETVATQATTAVGDLTKSAVTMAGRKVLKNYFGDTLYTEVFFPGKVETAAERKSREKKEIAEKDRALQELQYVTEANKRYRLNSEIQKKYDAKRGKFKDDLERYVNSSRHENMFQNKEEKQKYIKNIMAEYDKKKSPEKYTDVYGRTVKDLMNEYDLKKKAGLI